MLFCWVRKRVVFWQSIRKVGSDALSYSRVLMAMFEEDARDCRECILERLGKGN